MLLVDFTLKPSRPSNEGQPWRRKPIGSAAACGTAFQAMSLSSREQGLKARVTPLHIEPFFTSSHDFSLSPLITTLFFNYLLAASMWRSGFEFWLGSLLLSKSNQELSG
jgi:hypothetical protein